MDDISLHADKIFNLKLFPNPTEGEIYAEFFIPNDHMHELIVYNTDGTEVSRLEFENAIGNQKVKLDLSDQPAGNYLVEILESNYSTVKKFILK